MNSDNIQDIGYMIFNANMIHVLVRILLLYRIPLVLPRIDQIRKCKNSRQYCIQKTI